MAQFRWSNVRLAPRLWMLMNDWMNDPFQPDPWRAVTIRVFHDIERFGHYSYYTMFFDDLVGRPESPMWVGVSNHPRTVIVQVSRRGEPHTSYQFCSPINLEVIR